MSIVSSERGIRAIETRFAGCLFRSRLEARWAVFFQTLGVLWHYEPEGFKLSTGDWYLPDFLVRLKGRSLWVEIKPVGIPAPLFNQFMADIKQPGTILNEIPDPEIMHHSGHGFDFFDAGGFRDTPYQFCICKCGAVGFEFDGYSDRIPCGCSKPHREWTPGHPKILKALTAARSARFEAGS
jgi:hypothetical protein